MDLERFILGLLGMDANVFITLYILMIINLGLITLLVLDNCNYDGLASLRYVVGMKT